MKQKSTKPKATQQKTSSKSTKISEKLAKFSGGKSGAEMTIMVALIEAGIFAVFLLIEPIKHCLWLLPVILPIINGAWYLVCKAGKVKSPLYFFITLIFLILVGSTITLNPLVILLIGLGTIVLSAISVCVICKTHNIATNWGHISWYKIFGKYKILFKKDPSVKKRLVLHATILFISGIFSAIFSDIHGVWISIAAASVLAGTDLDDIKGRSILGIIGALVSFIIASFLTMFNTSTLIAVILLILGVILVMSFPPMSKYALGSAGIGLAIVAISSLMVGSVSSELLWQRLGWVLLGVAIVIVVVFCGSRIGQQKSE